MIQEAVVVMTILGCGNEADNCDYVSTPNKKWESVTACEAAIPAQLTQLDDVAYPVLTANCAVEKPIVVVQHNENEPVANGPATLPTKENVFNRLRAKADTTDIDLLGKAKASLERLSQAPKKVAAKIKTVFTNQ